jgi:hypothetical protein
VPSFSLPLNGSPTADVGTIPIPVALFAAPALAGLLAYAGRLRRTMRRGRTATTTKATKRPPRPG